MCGITGYININGNAVPDTDTIMDMLSVQKHRGPDDSGIRAFSLVSGQSAELGINERQKIDGRFEGILGFNRLSILDLSANGHQPMVSPDGKVILTLNGEIYNAFDYTNELEQWGYRFRSTSDTEIVLALYLKYGFEGMLARLNGMFAIVIVDLGKYELFITRDRFGIKPMYYISTSEILAFSSELKSFRYLDNFSFELLTDQLDEYLMFRNNLRGTLFKNIHLLEPGHYLSFTVSKGLRKNRYFNIQDFTRDGEAFGDLDSYSEKMEEWMSRSVKRQLISDVKLGCQLSGGIDSSLVTWLANRNSGNEAFETVSVIFRDQRFSEEKYMDIVTGKLNITSHKFMLDLDYFSENIERATWHFEQPIEHQSNLALFYLSQRAKECVTVLLSGEGSDEIFAGYNRFINIRHPYQGRVLLSELKKNLTNPFNMVNYLRYDYRAVMATSYMTSDMAGMLYWKFSHENAIANRSQLYNSFSGSLFDRQIKYELSSYLPDLLICQDKMSMAHTIENRVPFVDNEVVKDSFTIPEKYLLVRNGPDGTKAGKYLLKKIAAKNFGSDFAFRRKVGFDIPVRELFANSRFKEFLSDKIIPGMKNRGLFKHELPLRWLDNITTINYHQLEALWIVVSFEIWASLYLDSNNDNRFKRR
jgi:asparagine synthase (glutamine-hydrolysing)